MVTLVARVPNLQLDFLTLDPGRMKPALPLWLSKPTCIVLKIAEIYANTTVLGLMKKILRIHGRPSSGSNTNTSRSPALESTPERTSERLFLWGQDSVVTSYCKPIAEMEFVFIWSLEFQCRIFVRYILN